MVILSGTGLGMTFFPFWNVDGMTGLMMDLELFLNKGTCPIFWITLIPCSFFHSKIIPRIIGRQGDLLFSVHSIVSTASTGNTISTVKRADALNGVNLSSLPVLPIITVTLVNVQPVLQVLPLLQHCQYR